MRIEIAYILALAGSAGALFLAGYAVGASEGYLPPEIVAHDELVSERQVDDAVRRWSIKASEPPDRIRERWSPRSMFIPTHNQASGMTCIQLHLDLGAMGGEPVYCYEDGTTKLLAEYSNVE